MRIKLFILAAALCTGLASPALADKDKDKGPGRGQGQGQGQGQGHQGQGQGPGGPAQGQGPGAGGPGQGARQDAVVPTGRVMFQTRDRGAVQSYYRSEFASGHCPPGLAKKNNGCMPPGQVARWSAGQRLPPTIVYYDLPPPLLQRLPPVPSGYRYTRVDNTVLLVETASRMIIDAITDVY